MAMTIQERRRRDCDKKRAQRAEQRAAKAPTPSAVQNAIAEAVSFAVSGINISDVRMGIAAIPVDLVVKTARNILIKRQGFDRERSIAAVAKLLRPRAEHRWPSHIPSHADPSQPVA